jgi:phosphate-selective porin
MEAKMLSFKSTLIVIILTGFLLSNKTTSADPGSDVKEDTSEVENANPRVTYTNKGWQFSTADEKYVLQFQSRLQFRFAAPFDTDPVTFEDYLEADQRIFKINRARLKIGGNAYEKWLKYYWEYELAASVILDFRLMIEKYPYLKFKAGQWKAQYSRERIISSGKQQMADRSIVNRAFTIDRQQGISFYGRYQGTGLADFNYWFSIFTGMGRGGRANDDENLMYMSRFQWNFLGAPVKFSGSDLNYTENAEGTLTLAAVTNRSPYTRFSTGGGGQLPGFDDGEPGQYRVNQALLGSAIKYHGFSWQQELHWKEIDDRVNNEITVMWGNYIQLGYFFHYLWSSVPKPLEAALRYSVLNPDRDEWKNIQRELSVAVNWFFKGHLNKLTAEFTFFKFEQDVAEERDDTRIRLQWDISM